MLTVKILDTKGNPPGKLADVELHFGSFALTEAQDETLSLTDEGRAALRLLDAVNVFAGMKLIGFAVWERRSGTGRNVTFPARQYSVNGERRSMALLRPLTDPTAQDAVRDLILDAYAAHEAEQLAANAGAIAAQVGL